MSAVTRTRSRTAEELLARLERHARRLEETEDPDEAIEILTELAEIAKEVEAAAPAGQAGGGSVNTADELRGAGRGVPRASSR